MEIDNALRAGKLLASPEDGEDIVISGIAGCFPESNNMYEFRDNLANKADMVTYDERRWDAIHPEIPKRAGKILNVEKFDAGFFGVHHQQCHALDPLCRVLMEKVYESIFDAGINPKDLEGSNTGIYVGACASESEKYWFYDHSKAGAQAITGCHRSMLAARAGYALKLQGPAFVMDTACSSSLFAFEHAYRAIREGRCERAIVAGANLCLHPYVALQFSRLGVLSPDGACKCFDEAANGYTRSEAICSLLLQKSKEAKRFYAHVLHSKANADGYKEQGITYPSGDTQKNLLREVYQECQMNPNEISFMEAHGTGTKVGDPEELKAIDEIFLVDRKRPLLIGSVKSNIGHTEPTSGLCSVSKIILSMEKGQILPNMNYKTPRSGVPALADGRLKVVTENTNWPDNEGIVGINSFGFGGANCHAILRMHQNISTVSEYIKLPLIACFSGRTVKAVHQLIENIQSNYENLEYIQLINEIFKEEIPGHEYRGFLLLDTQKFNHKTESIKWLTLSKPRLVYVFGEFDTCWNKIIGEMLKVEQFAASIHRMEEILDEFNINLMEILEDHEAKYYEQKFYNLRTVCYTISFLEIFNDLGLSPQIYFGYSIGHLICSYLEGTLSLKEALVSSFDYCGCKATNFIIPKDSYIIKLGLVPQWLPTTFGEILDIQNLHTFFVSLGKIYLSGNSVDVKKLYPQVRFPVPRGTPMISPIIKWDHHRDWFVTKFRAQDIIQTGFAELGIDTKDDFWKFVMGHVIDGRNLFPATGYLLLAWDVLGMINGKMTSNMRVIFENVKFLRATHIPRNKKIKMSILVQRGTGYFEISENSIPVATGRIREFDEDKIGKTNLPIPARSTILLTQKDIYTELKLRGYNYRGAFKGLKDVDISCSSGMVDWTTNWITFLDNMLQIKLLQYDTRSLYVPTGIKSICINAAAHSKLGEIQKEFPVYAYKDFDTIRCGGVEIRGIHAHVINRRKVPSPVLEKYVFVPNETRLEVEESIRVMMQTALENAFYSKLKIIEIFTNHEENLESKQDDTEASEVKDEKEIEETDEVRKENRNLILSTLIGNSLEDLPLIEADLRIFTKETNLELPSGTKITIEDKEILHESDIYMVVAEGEDLDKLPIQKLHKQLKNSSFLLVRTNNEELPTYEEFNVILKHETPRGFFLLYLRNKSSISQVYLKYDEDGTCLTELKALAEKKKDQQIVLYTNNTENGLLGFTNCLRKEQGTYLTRCVLTDPDFKLDINNPIIKEQLSKGMSFNILKKGIWGTYRHLLLDLEQMQKVKVNHAYVNSLRRGDLSSLSWIQGPLNPTDENIVRVHYAAVNFRDLMTASGRVSVDAITMDRLEQECVQGFEYSGIDSTGRRVFGMLSAGGLATLIKVDPDMLLTVPDDWSLEDAVTVPVVYGTVLYSFWVRAGGLKEGQTILIHSGTGGVGQAAISIALYYKCEVFTTVGSMEKREYLLKKFPALKTENIGNSRDISFENLILKRTNNKGVDIVLNSLAEEKLQASLRCLAVDGCYLEIGKFDLALDNNIQMELFEKGISFHGIMLDGVFKTHLAGKQELVRLLHKGIEDGAIKPLDRTVFERDELEKTFRYMATGKHVGKVVIKVRPDENLFESSNFDLFDAVPKYFCPKYKSCLVIGGLGGFGLELCDWLIIRGCKELFITSRNGPRTGYQYLRLQTWRNYGATVTILRENLYTYESCERVLEEAGYLDAVFNLAVVLHDDLLENQTVPNLLEVLDAKVTTTKYLDQLTRRMCPDLTHFVVFSSVTCGRGNIGQVNYGLANSIMERIIEERKKDHLPAIAIQWGSIADVGLAAELMNDDIERPIGGTLPQRMSNCLELLDSFLVLDDPIVSSMVVAEKRGGMVFGSTMLETIVNILGIRDIKTVSMHSTLPELGMDSMMGVEIKQTLEREYDVHINPNDIRTLTLAKIQEIERDRNLEVPISKEKKEQSSCDTGAKFLLRHVNDEECSKIGIMPMKTKDTPAGRRLKGFLLPGVEGFASILDVLSSKLEFEAFGLQFRLLNPPATIQEMAELLVPNILPHLSKRKPFNIIAYSYGCMIAIELAIILEKKHHFKGNLILIDGSHELMLKLTHQQTNVSSKAHFETDVLCNIFSMSLPANLMDLCKTEMLKKNNFDERLAFIQTNTRETHYSKEYIRKICLASHARIKAILHYESGNYKLESKIYLFKPTIQVVTDIEEYYKLEDYSKLGRDGIKLKIFDADHYTILDSDIVAEEVNKIVIGKEEDSLPIEETKKAKILRESSKNTENIQIFNEVDIKIR